MGRVDSAILHRPRVENVADWYFLEPLCTVVMNSCQSKDFSTVQLGKTWHPSTLLSLIVVTPLVVSNCRSETLQLVRRSISEKPSYYTVVDCGRRPAPDCERMGGY